MSAPNPTLNRLIDQWCKESLGSAMSTASAERLDELKDHLACVAEARLEQGASVEEAMAYAVAQFGDTGEVREHLKSAQPAFRRWIARIHCNSATTQAPQKGKTVLVSLLFAAVLLICAWLVKDSRSFAFIYTVVIGMWVVIASRQGGTRAAAKAEWQWLKRKFGF